MHHEQYGGCRADRGESHSSESTFCENRSGKANGEEDHHLISICLHSIRDLGGLRYMGFLFGLEISSSESVPVEKFSGKSNSIF